MKEMKERILESLEELLRKEEDVPSGSDFQAGVIEGIMVSIQWIKDNF